MSNITSAQQETPIWVAETEDNSTSRPVSFSSLNAIRDTVISLALIWPTNSYRVNVRKKFFIINGGLPLQFDKMNNELEGRLLYVRRNSQQLSVGGSNGSNAKISAVHTRYLIGYTEGSDEGQMRLLEISSDGRVWTIRDHK